MSSHSRRVAIKVDCDTFEGTKVGLPNLLRLFDKAAIRASFFFTLGPDRSGRAIRRVFTHKGFLKKMLRSKAVSLYGPKTMMYGTLLPAPHIGKRLESEIRSVAAAGHEVGVHGWDHVAWHDNLDHMSWAEIERDYNLAHDTFETIFSRKARASAAPGWHASKKSLAIQERFELLYASNTRGDVPCFPRLEGRTFHTLEIPTTLPTWDETLADPHFKGADAVLDFYKSAVRGNDVHTIHTEVEGTAYADLFQKQIELWKAEGVLFWTLEEFANETLLKKESVPERDIIRVAIPNRGGLVSSVVDGATVAEG